MRQRLLIIAAVVAVFCQASSLYAGCPQTYWVFEDDTWNEYLYPDQIFCDTFDSYCATGGPPGTPNCAPGSGKSNEKLQEVWYPVTAGGTTMIVQDGSSGVIADIFSGRYTSAIYLGQESVRDWVASAQQSTDVLNVQRFVNNVHGGTTNAVNGTDEAPLVMKFLMAENLEKLFYSGGYMELALGERTDNLNRANTDYALRSASCCNETNRAFPVICAQGNPDSTLPSACPVVGTTPPPVHQAIAVGAFSSLDNDPCDGCGPNPTYPTQYRQNVRHLALFDGKVWWTLNGTTLPPGASVSGSITPALPDPPPPNFVWQPGDFYLVSTLLDNGYKTPNSQCYNEVELTVYETTITVKLVNRVRTDPGGVVYWVTSIMENIPRQYLGSFDQIRAGVGPGCALASNTDWAGCLSIDGRGPLENTTGSGVNFDNFLLYGGVGTEEPGACCKADGTCEQMLKSVCETLDINGNPMGRFTSVGQACNASIGCCPFIYGDTDFDNDLDMDDFAKLQTCLTTGGGTVSSDCRCLNTDGDADIDSDDLLKFLQCANGPGVAANTGVSCRGSGW